MMDTTGLIHIGPYYGDPIFGTLWMFVVPAVIATAVWAAWRGARALYRAASKHR